MPYVMVRVRFLAKILEYTMSGFGKNIHGFDEFVPYTLLRRGTDIT